MKKRSILQRTCIIGCSTVAATATLLVVGCGPSYEDVEEPNVSEADVSAMVEQAIKEQEQDTGNPASAGGPAAPPPPGAAPPPAAAAMQEGAPIDVENPGTTADGALQSDVDLLNEAITYYYDPTARGIDQKIEALLARMDIRSEKEEYLARKQLEAKYAIPPLQSLDQLVSAKIIARLPEPRPGKKFVLEGGVAKEVAAP